MAQKRSFNGRRDLLKMSPKSTRERTADPAASPKRPKDTPKSRSQHSGRVGDNLMRVLKLRSSSTTSTQQRSTICSHRPCILDFCAPRRRHARRRARPTLPWPTLKITNAERNESSKSSTITRAPPPSSKLTLRWCASHPRCLN